MRRKENFNDLDYTVKTCVQCQEEKHVTEFRLIGKYLASWCKSCASEYRKEWRKQPEVKAKEYEDNRRRHLLKTYGITLEQYNELLSKQGHRCALCDKHEDDCKTKLAVDHDHITGEIRGLLCNYCNRRQVGRHRDGSLLRRMAEYVEQGTGWFVPKRKTPVKRKPKRS